MTLSRPAIRAVPADATTPPPLTGVPAFDTEQFDDLSEMIGEDGVMEMVTIFDAETRQRLLRVAAGDQDMATLVREMHTLKGAAGTVAAPSLTALGQRLEFAARQGIAPTGHDLVAIAGALEAWLAAVHSWSANHESTD